MPNISNPEAFQLEAAIILAAGYTTFPGTFDWAYDSDTEIYPTETGKSREKIQFETIIWLKENGYLHGGGLIGNEWKGLKLTDRALNALNAVSDVLSGAEPLGKRLVVAVGKGSIETIKQLIPIFVQQALSG